MNNYDDFFEKTLKLLLLDDTNKKISAEGLKQVKTIKYTDDMKLKKCPIDLDYFKENEDISELPCRHKFKKELILKWLKEQQNCCPVCRYELLGEGINMEKILNLEITTLLNITNLNSMLD